LEKPDNEDEDEDDKDERKDGDRKDDKQTRVNTLCKSRGREGIRYKTRETDELLDGRHLSVLFVTLIFLAARNEREERRRE